MGSTLRNPDLARTYREIARDGAGAFYRGPIAGDVVRTVQQPPVAGSPVLPWPSPIRPGTMSLADLDGYRLRFPAPTRSAYRGYEVYGMPMPSSGGTAVGEALYTLTIEATGGNGMVVPGRGFLLNNGLTDFTFAQAPNAPPDPNLPAPFKRPRSSMSPTIVLDGGKPFLALGTPGGATIITTVLQLLVNRIDFGLTLPAAMAAPRASQRNSAAPQAEPAFLAAYGAALAALGHTGLAPVSELGAATAIEFQGGGRLIASTEPVRRGGGAAAVLHG